ncbi:hypothetical protein BKA66DRAFT_555266 [Pyrenochaeta sp. MPI-SDFR-AT-0127]|nr:hypothetical protein BKA66DRAFT_555266 [Pyrenochaeta sp. MPI-SDFR-AT-0127]
MLLEPSTYKLEPSLSTTFDRNLLRNQTLKQLESSALFPTRYIQTPMSLSFNTPKHGAQGDQPQGSSPETNQSTPDASDSEPSMLEWFFGRVEVTGTGPAFHIRDGKISFNGVAISNAVWKAMSTSPSVPNRQDPSIVNFLNAHGLPSDLDSRKDMATKMGLDPSTMGYKEGNLKLLELLRASYQ